MKMPDKFYFYNKLEKFREEFSVGDDVLWEEYGEWHEASIFGITTSPNGWGDYIASVEFTSEGEHFVRLVTLEDWGYNHIVKLKKKDELEPGDKFIGLSGFEYEVLGREYDESIGVLKYFVLKINTGFVTTFYSTNIKEVLHNG